MRGAEGDASTMIPKASKDTQAPTRNRLRRDGRPEPAGDDFAARNAAAGDDADPGRPEQANPKRDDYPSPPAYGASTLSRPRAKPTAGPSLSPAGHATQPHSTGLLVCC